MSLVSPALSAGGWGLVAGSALVIGAVLGYATPIPVRVISAVMAFGGGVLVSLLSFDLVEEAYAKGGPGVTVLGFVMGAGLFTAGNYVLSRHGAKHRKRSGAQQPSEAQHAGSGLAIALGSLLDSVPESIVIGVSLLAGAGVSLVAVVAVFLSNVPEGLASSAGMRKAGRSPLYVFGTWGAIAVACGLAALIGFVAFAALTSSAIAFTMAFAAGAILTMLATTMFPEAFAGVHTLSGFLAVVGFLAAFLLSKIAG